ncbi:hypothetical protein ZOSMA_9G00180 [Zostera marina]|uniref:SAUR-like auxin-responsive protein family n=1 Tax=Zostera marina TaxID=29655 RepID=A0A0K9NIK9_ZOSMR|nr:hypothetical protein ZOSMA_9G00180 [Zostera marina]
MMKKIVSMCGRKSSPRGYNRDLSWWPKEGFVKVCVGKKDSGMPLQEFELETNLLNHRLFKDLLELSVEEYGYDYCGALRIACEVELFLCILNLLRGRDPSVHYKELSDINY